MVENKHNHLFSLQIYNLSKAWPAQFISVLHSINWGGLKLGVTWLLTTGSIWRLPQAVDTGWNTCTCHFCMRLPGFPMTLDSKRDLPKRTRRKCLAFWWHSLRSHLVSLLTYLLGCGTYKSPPRFKRRCYALSIHIPPNSHVESLISYVMAFGGRNLGRWLNVDEVVSEMPLIGLVSLQEEEGNRAPSLSLSLSLHFEDTARGQRSLG